MTLAIGEGLCGIALFFIALPILQFIPCDAENLCVNGKVSDMTQVYRDFAANPILIAYAVGSCFFSTLMFVSMMSTLKYGSATQKVMTNLMRPLLIWVFFMSVNIQDIETGEYV